ncbi:MAG: hypothetical protein RLZZ262_2199 [Bacteroidota bacterium]|jgi:hypothetical protein
MTKWIKNILQLLAIIIALASCSKEAVMGDDCVEIKEHRIEAGDTTPLSDPGLAGSGTGESEEEQDISDDDDEEDDDDIEDISDDDDEEDDDETENVRGR